MAGLRMAMAWQRLDRAEDVAPAFLPGSAPFQLVPEVGPRPSEAVFDKITMSCLLGTPLDLALRDCGINAFAVVGVALEVGIEPTVRHAVLVTRSPGNVRSDGLAFAGDAVITDTATIAGLLRRAATR